MTIEEIKEECERMQSYLEITTTDDTNELVGRLTDINVYLARSGFLLAEARLMQDKATQAVFSHYTDALVKMPSNTAKQFISSATADINYVVNWLDRLNRACVHQGDNLRTQISFSKEELKLTRSGY